MRAGWQALVSRLNIGSPVRDAYFKWCLQVYSYVKPYPVRGDKLKLTIWLLPNTLSRTRVEPVSSTLRIAMFRLKAARSELATCLESVSYVPKHSS